MLDEQQQEFIHLLVHDPMYFSKETAELAAAIARKVGAQEVDLHPFEQVGTGTPGWMVVCKDHLAPCDGFI